MKLSEIMTRFPLSIDSTESVWQASQRMAWSGSRHLPVMHEGDLIGIITTRDLAAFHAGGGDVALETSVEKIMTSTVQTARPDDSMHEAAGRMAAHKIGCLPITERGELVGIVTTTDILNAQVRQALGPVPDGPCVGDVMSRDMVTAHADDHLVDAAARMQTNNIRHLPVVDGQGRVVGMLSDRDIRTAIGDFRRILNGLQADSGKIIEDVVVSDIMTRDPETVVTGANCGDVAWIFVDHAIGALPVVNAEEKLVGIVSYVDILRVYAGARTLS